MKILIIEDDALLSHLLTTHLHQQGYDVVSAAHGQDGLDKASQIRPDLVILDVMMPGMDGWEVCRRLRETSQVSIIMLTAKATQTDVIHGLELGVDDYVTKPFDLRELELRIKAVTRRSQVSIAGQQTVYDDGTLRIDLERRVVLREGQPVHLTPTEYRLLSCLVEHRGRVVPHEEILGSVWGPEYVHETAILSVYIRYLRQKLEEDPGEPRYIHTEWGVGYRFSQPQPVLDRS